MKIETLKDLKALIKLCRQTGVEAIEVDGLKMNLGPTPTIIKRTRTPKASRYLQETANGPIETPDSLTDEQLLYYSVSDN